MAYGSAAVTATELTDLAADSVMLIGRNWLRGSTAAARWTAGTWTTDQSDSDGPAAYSYDDQDYLQTYPSATAYPYLVINLGVTTAVVDCIVLLNHNGFSCGATTVDVEFDQNQNGSFSAVDQAYSAAATDDVRLVLLDLKHTGSTALRYSDVQYLRIGFPGCSTVPKIGEVIVGRRRQTNRHPKAPWNDKHHTGSAARVVSDSGVIKQYNYHKGCRRISNAVLEAHEDAYVSDLDSWFEDDTDLGTLPFMWIDEPSTDPQAGVWVQLDVPERSQQIEGYIERNYTITATEKGPNFRKLGV
jgi:hypothetical protein